MAMAHEEMGDVPEAIRCYEDVVRLRPESKIDAIKLSQLREASNRPSTVTPSKRGLAVVLSIGAALLAVAVGMAFAWPRGAESEKQDTTLLADNSVRGFDVPEQTQAPLQPASAVQPEAQVPPSQPVETRTNPSNPTGRAVLPPASPSGRTPSVRPPTTEPLTVNITPEQLPKNTPPPTAEQTTSAGTRPGDENVIERRPGQINISESRKGNPTDPNVSENTYRIAQDKMKAGDYRGAIRDFQAALGGSDRKALIHQLIGRCYTRLGDKGAAKQHFETALAMYEAAGAKSAADAARREIGLLG
jgi:TolA-binding protein